MIGRLIATRLPEPERRRAAINAMSSEDDLVLTFERDALTWTVDPGDEIGMHLFSEGRYEGDALDAVASWLRAARPSHTFRIVVDVGANVGTTSVRMAQADYKTIAIEPVPTTFKLLVSDVSANGLSDRVTCVQKAISADRSHAEIWVTRGSGQSEFVVPGKAPAFSRWGLRATGSVEMEGDGLTSILASCGVQCSEIALTWSDTQGNENAVIETGRELWSAGVPLYVEVWPAGLAVHGGIDASSIAFENHSPASFHGIG
jgi:FkbM family methyltransferase